MPQLGNFNLRNFAQELSQISKELTAEFVLEGASLRRANEVYEEAKRLKIEMDIQQEKFYDSFFNLRDEEAKLIVQKETDLLITGPHGLYESLLNRCETASMQTKKEFAYKKYIIALKTCIRMNKDRIISIDDSRGNYDIRFKINMESVCGRSSDYATAVQIVDNRIKSKHGLPDQSSSGVTATTMFLEKYYEVDKNGKLVYSERLVRVGSDGKTRKVRKEVTPKYRGELFDRVDAIITACRGKAPWWELVENGNIDFRIPGKDAENPLTFEPTHFVSRLEEEFNAKLRSNLYDAFTNLDMRANEFNNSAGAQYVQFMKIYERIERIILTQSNRNIRDRELEVAQREIRNAFAAKGQYPAADKIIEAANKVLSEIEIGQTRTQIRAGSAPRVSGGRQEYRIKSTTVINNIIAGIKSIR